jgi:hypothetical protein
MSQDKTPTVPPLLPKLPLEIYLKEWCLVDKWEFVDDGKVGKRFRCYWNPNRRRKPRLFPARDFLFALGKIQSPQELFSFVNKYCSPVTSFDSFLGPGVPFRWSEFLSLQRTLLAVMVLPLSTIRRRRDLEPYRSLASLDVTVKQRDGIHYYGELVFPATIDGCVQAMAIERLLGDVKYDICEFCGKPYEITSNHYRKYCSTDKCAHYAAVKRSRQR